MMVTDTSIEKVMMVCDRGYKEKADNRKGGAGIEAQILTPHLYKQKGEGKFVAVLSERDEQGEPFVPAYYASRLYIDLSDPTRHGEMFERLVRWVFNKPLHEAPAVGEPPAYLREDAERVRLATSITHTRAVEALRNNRPRALVAVSEYLDNLIAEMEKFRISLANRNNQPEIIRSSVVEFLPYRNQFMDMIAALAIHATESDAAGVLHRFFERCLELCNRRTQGSGTTWDNANLKFIVYEMFLVALAVEFKHNRFDMADVLINGAYYVGDVDEFHNLEMVTFEAFWSPNDPFAAWWNDKDPRPYSAVGELVNSRVGHGDISMRHICSVDLLLCLRSVINSEDLRRWVAMTTIYAGHSNKAFELFARCQSSAYFERVKHLIGIKTPDELKERVAQFDAQGRNGYIVRSGFGSSVATMTGAERIASRP